MVTICCCWWVCTNVHLVYIENDWSLVPNASQSHQSYLSCKSCYQSCKSCQPHQTHKMGRKLVRYGGKEICRNNLRWFHVKIRVLLIECFYSYLTITHIVSRISWYRIHFIQNGCYLTGNDKLLRQRITWGMMGWTVKQQGMMESCPSLSLLST